MQRKALYSKSRNINDLITEGQEWNFHDADTAEFLHSLHPYPAKFIPQIPRKAIKTWTKPGELVCDPFCGCGTTLLEASLLGRPSVGVDNNAVAVLVSKAKTAQYTTSDLQDARQFESSLKSRLAKAKPRKELIPDNPNFLYWFGTEVLQRLSAIKSLILEESEPLQTLFLAVFSSIIVRVSYQDSDTRYTRITRVVDPSDVDKAFRSSVSETISNLSEVVLPNRAPVMIYQADSRSMPFISDDSVSLIVTSPPYLNAYDYHKYHRQRIHWIGGNVSMARDLEIGKHDEFTRRGATPAKYFEDMNSCFLGWSRVLRCGGKCLVVVGDAIVNGQPVQVADTFVELLQEQGFSLIKHWIRELQSTRRAFNVRNSRISHEHVLLVEKT